MGLGGCAGGAGGGPGCRAKAQVILKLMDERGEPLRGVRLQLRPVAGRGPTSAVSGQGGIVRMWWQGGGRRECLFAFAYRINAPGRVETSGTIHKRWSSGPGPHPPAIYEELVVPSVKAVVGAGISGSTARACLEAYKSSTAAIKDLNMRWMVPAFEKIPGGVRARVYWEGNCWAPLEVGGARAEAVVCAMAPLMGLMSTHLAERLSPRTRIELQLTSRAADPHDPYAPARIIKALLATTAERLQALNKGEIPPTSLIEQGLKITEERPK